MTVVLPLLDLTALPVEIRADGAVRLIRASRAAGLERLGCMLTELAPGHAAWQRHAHRNNDELVYVLAGRGEAEYGERGERRISIAAGDLLCFPASAAAGAHRLVNTGGEILRYLAVSSMLAPDVVEYPDGGKLGLYLGAAPGGSAERRQETLYFRRRDAVAYED
ncbi:cupin domain-containing protein [Azoarcus indigens]|uniref:Cupin type-2 domain-containing protein n=1 Tax=Azoarcus indigens TaxID=29545 RepID=A0A4R6E603_9RHOO|nr:cupin domain-containing protein [Azoarcus indigens]NMG66043.1 cupin domain-containing protein [Azoarcus indigens]TDN53337.1 hypothetical protein C7389_10510 [Azoarcus indigens]